LWWAAGIGQGAVVKRWPTGTTLKRTRKIRMVRRCCCGRREKEHELVVQALLAQDDVDADSDTNGRTPLWWAAANGHEAE
jgi:ankyrin repeat protein